MSSFFFSHGWNSEKVVGYLSCRYKRVSPHYELMRELQMLHTINDRTYKFQEPPPRENIVVYAPDGSGVYWDGKRLREEAKVIFEEMMDLRPLQD